MTRPAAWLLVRAGGRLVGLALPRVLEVLEPGRVYPVPASEPAIRGVTTVRGRLLPVMHLGALLEGGACLPTPCEAVVAVDFGERRVCLEVDAAETVLLEAGLAVPHGATLPWALGVARHDGQLVPLLDLDAIGTRITETASA